MKWNKIKKFFVKLFFWIVVAIVMSPMLLIVGLLTYAYIVFPCSVLLGIHWKGVSYKYHSAIEKGDSKRAIFWAKRGHVYSKLGIGLRTPYELYIAQAYELDGQDEIAHLWYRLAIASKGKKAYWGENAIPSEALLDGRLLFKQEKKDKAFEVYCNYGEWCLEKYAEELANERWNDRNLALGKIRTSIIGEFEIEIRLTPFLDYKGFLDFMEEEYEKLGDPPEYTDVMELFRAIDSEIDEEHLPRSKASDNLDKVREAIRQERVKKLDVTR